MAAVDATEVVAWNLAIHLGHAFESIDPPKAGPNTRRLSDAALAALFSRAGIEGEGTIALTRDAEGRYGLEKQDGYPPVDGGVWWGRRTWLVPVEDDEEGRRG